MIAVSLGCNLGSSFRDKVAGFRTAIDALEASGCVLIAVSSLYSTIPLGSGRQTRYLNAVALFERGPPASQLLRLMKALERSAGRRFGRHWGPRVLDLDLLLHGRFVVGWPTKRRRRGVVIVPHPELHRRGFVLVPLTEVLAGSGRTLTHPTLGLSINQLTARLPAASRGIERLVDFPLWAAPLLPATTGK